MGLQKKQNTLLYIMVLLLGFAVIRVLAINGEPQATRTPESLGARNKLAMEPLRETGDNSVTIVRMPSLAREFNQSSNSPKGKSMIRLCQADDLPSINAIRWENHRIALGENEISNSNGWKTYVKVIDRKIIAYLTIRPKWGLKNGDAQFDVFVLPSEQGKGVGTELIQYAIAFVANSTRYQRLTLGVEKDNHNAMRLYQRLGFQEVGSNRFGYTMVRINPEKQA